VVLSNPLPVTGHIFVRFPASFHAVAPTAGAAALSGAVTETASATPTADGVTGQVTVDVARDGTGIEVPEGGTVVVALGGITNQQFEGLSGLVEVWTTLANGVTDIDRGNGNEVSSLPIMPWLCPLGNACVTVGAPV
jgi:streptogramin lyase